MGAIIGSQLNARFVKQCRESQSEKRSLKPFHLNTWNDIKTEESQLEIRSFAGDRHLLFLGGIRRPWNEHLTVHPVNRHFCTEQRRHAWLRSKIHRASRQSLRVSDLPHSSSRPSSDNTLWTSYVQHLLAANLKVNSVMPCYSFQFQYRHLNSPDSLSNISPEVSSENMTHIKGNILYW